MGCRDANTGGCLHCLVEVVGQGGELRSELAYGFSRRLEGRVWIAADGQAGHEKLMSCVMTQLSAVAVRPR